MSRCCGAVLRVTTLCTFFDDHPTPPARSYSLRTRFAMMPPWQGPGARTITGSANSSDTPATWRSRPNSAFRGRQRPASFAEPNYRSSAPIRCRSARSSSRPKSFACADASGVSEPSFASSSRYCASSASNSIGDDCRTARRSPLCSVRSIGLCRHSSCDACFESSASRRRATTRGDAPSFGANSPIRSPVHPRRRNG